MKDYIFYPLALCLALAVIAAAALPGRDRLGCGSVSGAGTDYKLVEVDGDDLCRMNAGGQATIKRLTRNGEIEAIRVSSKVGELGDRADRNPHFPLAADLEKYFAGKRIHITITARSSEDWGASAFEANYSAGREGSSDWQTFRLTPNYRDYSFTWDVPPRIVQELTLDYLAIRPVVPDKQRAVDIRSVVLKVVGRSAEIRERLSDEPVQNTQADENAPEDNTPTSEEPAAE